VTSASSPRDSTPSFPKMLLRWVLTVRGEMPRSCAISLFDFLAVTSCAISISPRTQRFGELAFGVGTRGGIAARTGLDVRVARGSRDPSAERANVLTCNVDVALCAK